MLTDPISQSYLVLSPQASAAPGETHAALVVSQAVFSDVRFSAGFETLEQLRTGSAPNPWESAWAVFDYTDNQHFYYVAFKPNGWELGKADPAYPGAQRFLATGEMPVSAIGTEHTFAIEQDGNVIKVWLDGVLLTTFTDTENPYLGGKIGFYTEDAKVAFDNVSGSMSDDFESYAPHVFSDGAALGASWETPFVGYGFGAIARDETPWVTGTARSDWLYGTRQNDLIDGAGGADLMVGRGGDDTYKIDNTRDYLVERAGGGVDTVLSTASSHALGRYVENLTLEGATPQTGVGNALDNILVSNDVAGILHGGAGDDILVSGHGNDILSGGPGADVFVFTAAPAGAVRHITDFDAGEDKIDLHHLFDADSHLSFNPNARGGTDILVDGDLVVAVDAVALAEVELGANVFWH